MAGFNYLEYKNGDFPISENLSKKILSLPMHSYLSSQEVQLIIKNLK